MVFDLIIIGAGAAGVSCAISAARNNKSVLLLEHKDRVLKKVLVTGNGRCNFSNLDVKPSRYIANNRKIIDNILKKYTAKEIISFFNGLGILERIDKGTRIYPNSFQASSIVDALRFELDNLGVLIKLEYKINNIEKKGEYFVVDEYKSKNLVIATGGYSYKELGSDGSGYEIAKKFGHTLTKLHPILVQLKTDKSYIKGLEGIRQDVNVKVKYKGELLREEYGELLFTPYGISGPTIFTLSYLTSIYGYDLDFEVDFLPEFDKEKLKKYLYDRRKILENLEIQDFLNGVVHKKLGIFLLKNLGVEKMNLAVKSINDEVLNKLANSLKGYRIRVEDTMGYKQAQVTAGGIDSNEFDENMQSKKIKNLYLIGEILDIYGDCGGFNLHYAISSGLMVGEKC